ncbi:peptidoglycan-binding domain-containing protein [Fodinicola feengrottensis]|uniref:peptidoglycan-binding domain-containing protein n=1 Tax=Fodinicola feengrottensis TaxID=435914 RepID=UPI002442E7AF|nr:peptidoglycan-binding domain-containing protein [Fodinicola feengrottensis]
MKRLQRALTAALGRTVGIDGDFGSGTATAVVRNYQTAAGLSSDGIVGPNTWSALQHGH